jgi:hypothetical protein
VSTLRHHLPGVPDGPNGTMAIAHAYGCGETRLAATCSAARQMWQGGPAPPGDAEWHDRVRRAAARRDEKARNIRTGVTRLLAYPPLRPRPKRG